MAKEWILNSAMNRFQLNFKRNVGPTSESIRKCAPKTKDEWREYYFTHVRPKEHIIELGKRLYIKITEVIHAEVNEIIEQDCIDYMMQIVIDRTFDIYMTEINTIYGQLQQMLGVKIHAATDEWDRLYNGDFFIQVREKYIGLQIKPVSRGIQIPEIYKEINRQAKTHESFTRKYGGRVFYVFSEKVGDKKVIKNIDVVDEIKREIELLSTE